jgi:hypothetical protein
LIVAWTPVDPGIKVGNAVNNSVLWGFYGIADNLLLKARIHFFAPVTLAGIGE